RRECRGQTSWHLALIDEVAQGQAWEHERHPHVRSKVVVGEFKGLVDSFLAHGQEITAWRVKAVVQRFSSTPVHRGCAEACGKEHGEPDRHGVCRFFIVITQAQVSVLGNEDSNEEDEHERVSADVHPTEVFQQPVGYSTVYISSFLTEGES